jgi:hypothetical protein
LEETRNLIDKALKGELFRESQGTTFSLDTATSRAPKDHSVDR